MLQSPLVATSTIAVTRLPAAYSVRKTAVPTPRGTANVTVQITSQTVPTIAGATPLIELVIAKPSITNGQWNQTVGPSMITHWSQIGTWNHVIGPKTTHI